MTEHIFRLPDLGEGTVSAEVVAWHAQVGDLVREDQPLVEMSTDKAVVEVPSPVTGRLLRQAAQPGESIPVGAELAMFELAPAAGAAASATATAPAQGPVAVPAPAPGATAPAVAAAPGNAGVAASPATRRRASEAGVDLAAVRGTGPGGRITDADLDAYLQSRAGSGAGMGASASPAPAAEAGSTVAPAAGMAASDEPVEVPVIGVRRVIAQRMSEAARSIPHFSYVEEVDITALHELRARLNHATPAGSEPLTFLPFVVLALVRALREWPQCNAHYDAQRERLLRYAAVHVGIATQTPDGLKVPVVRHAEALALRPLAHQIAQVTRAARDNSARREQLAGSTITVTSLGRLGGIASTPIINAPEVAIIGVNRATQRPMVVDGSVQVRWMMNLSSSFDHRFIDGADAAGLIATLKGLLEQPAALAE